MSPLSQTVSRPGLCGYAGTVAMALLLTFLFAASAQADDRSKPYLSANSDGPDSVLHQSEPAAEAPPAARDARTEQLQKLLLHSALADSSAFGLLQALSKSGPAAPVPSTSSAASNAADDCPDTSREKT